LVVKIPLFEENVCKLQFVYPVPTNNQLILIPTSKYFCNNLWFEQCSSVNKWFCINQENNQCKIKSCTYAKVTNKYTIALYTQMNNLLVCSNEPLEVLESCKIISKKLVNNCNLILSNCDVIIGTKRFSNIMFNVSYNVENLDFKPVASKTIDLKLSHLQEPIKLHGDLLEPIKYTVSSPKAVVVHYSLTSFTICIVIIIIVVNIIVYRKRIKNSIPRKLLQKMLNEDVDNSKEGGVIGPSRPC